MANDLKVVSGVIFTDPAHITGGHVDLDFATNTVTGDGTVYPAGQDAETIGPNTAFASEPCKVVSLRWIRTGQVDGNFNLTDFYNDVDRRKSIRIYWDAPPGGGIHEISYMFMGYAGREK